MTQAHKNTNGSSQIMTGLDANLRTVSKQSVETGTERGNVYFKEFHRGQSYEDFDGAQSLESFTQELYREGFEEMLRDGRKKAAPLFAPEEGDNLRSLRMKAGMTQAELAKKSGQMQYRISNYETGRGKPDYETMKKIMAALDVDANTLFEALNKDV